MKKSISRTPRSKIALRLCMILCLCVVLTLLPWNSMMATAAGTEGMITIELADSYGDGWSDNAIEIYADGVLLGVATMDDGASSVWTTPIDPHMAYEFRWVSGTYAHETSFAIFIGTENKVSASGYDYAGGAVILSVEQSCDGPRYQGGVCADCGAACNHRYVGLNGKCADCGHACSGHNWVDGICTVCSGICLHQSYESGACNVCGAKMVLAIEMADVYSDGWTDNAIKIFADGVLVDTVTIDIGFSNLWTCEYNADAVYTFEWVRGNYADECSFRILLVGEVKYEATTDDCAALAEGVFLTLRPWCPHDTFDENYCCTKCGEPCSHDGIEPKGTCTVCGFACGSSAPHAWDKGVCAVCNLNCAHGNWKNGVCGICGLACGSTVPHNFDGNHTCSVCGFACGTSAPHAWNKGTCAVCGLTCDHAKYTNGICTVCGDYQSAVQNGVGANGFALYEIHNAGQLLWFADYVNANQVLSTVMVQEEADNSFYFEYTSGCVNGKLMADIDMTGLNWTPIGVPYLSSFASRNSYGYAGVFDGNGHTVSGVSCNVTTADNTVYAGFFGALGGGTVKNLTVKGNIQGIVTNTYYPAAYVGGIVGYACEWFDYPDKIAQNRQEIQSNIMNCTFIGTVKAESADQGYVGGIAGMASGTSFSNCLSAATLSVAGLVKITGASCAAASSTSALSQIAGMIPPCGTRVK